MPKEEVEEENTIYSEEGVDDAIEDEEISAEEEGFMQGYNKALDKKEETEEE